MAVWVDEISRIESSFRSRKQAYVRSSSRRQLEFLSLSFLFIVLFSQLCVRLIITETRYDIERVRAETLESDGRLREKKLELAEKTAPKALLAAANKRLGMVENSKTNTKKISW